MSEQLQLRRGSVSQVVGFIGAQGECVVDTTNNRLVVSDNATQGGWPAAKLSEVQTTLRASVPDANYPLTAPANSSTPWVTMIAYTALTAARTVNLPAASTFPTGTTLTVVDETGACSATLTITVAPHGTDLINGVNGSIVINQAFGSVVLESNGSNAWVIVSWWYSTTARKIVQSPSGATMSVNQVEFTTGTLSGSSYTCATQIPANCIVLSISARVETAITYTSTPTGWACGVSGNSSQFGGSPPGMGFALGTTNFGLIGPTAFYNPTNIILSLVGGTSPTFVGGVVKFVITYLGFAVPAF